MRQSFTRITACFILLIGLLSTLLLAQQQGNLVYDVKSQYQRISVYDTNGMRQLIFDGKFDGTDAIQSEMDKVDQNALTLSYAQHMICSLPLVAKPRRILIVGLGGACIERYLYNLLPDAKIETVELDPEVANVARKYFNLKEDARQVVHIGDGRKFIDESKDKYDFIMLDAFSATSIPYMLSTREFLEHCREHLTDGGILAANLWNAEPTYPSMLKTYDAVFPEWHVVKCSDSSNAILTALPTRRNVTKESWKTVAAAFDRNHKTGLELSTLLDKGFEATTRIPATAKVLLDKDEPKGK
ncbi:MAG TPA: fused MFS/spermidine synthase [Phycisphaerae bacterium]|nr:fused MFS/spermidine synthase [Phycisphaerae bacterium]